MSASSGKKERRVNDGSIGIEAPGLLRTTVDAFGEWAVVAEWELRVPTPQDGAAGTVRLTALARQLEAFQGAFPWVRVRALRTVVHTSEGLVDAAWSESSGSPAEALAAMAEEPCGGVEAELALDLSLPAQEGAPSRAWLAPAGRLRAERVTEIAVCWTFTVAVNLFSDSVQLFDRGADGALLVRSVDLGAAAAENRARLDASLRAWEIATGGEIVSWESELFEEGSVHRHGVTAGAAVR